MVFPLNAPLLELLVLAGLERQDNYGYQISRMIRRVAPMKDSTLYPILRKLQENGYVITYDQQFQGRNRRYYRMTEAGRRQYDLLAREWRSFSREINAVVSSGSATSMNAQANSGGSQVNNITISAEEFKNPNFHYQGGTGSDES